MRVLVVTVVHHPDDARIRHREIAALLDAGWLVTYAAPFSGYGVTPVSIPGLTIVDLPRARGRRRLGAWAAARRLLASHAPDHDIVLLHDPELLLAAGAARAARTPCARRLPPVVWDVHEDTVAALSNKPWLPPAAARLAAAAVRRVERSAEGRVHLLLAEDAYAGRFTRPHPVVPNGAWVPATVPPPDEPRAVYVGHLTRARGAAELVEVGRRLRSDGITVELVGHADEATAALLTAAQADGSIEWRGFLPLEEAMGRVSGSMAGLSLLHDEPNYRHSRPTKVIEYLAHGVPVVTTPLPLAAEIVEAAGAGVVVPFGTVEDPERCIDAVTAAVRALSSDADRRRRLGASGHAWARANVDWARHAPAFVATMEEYAAPPTVGPAACSAPGVPEEPGSPAEVHCPRDDR